MPVKWELGDGYFLPWLPLSVKMTLAYTIFRCAFGRATSYSNRDTALWGSTGGRRMWKRRHTSHGKENDLFCVYQLSFKGKKVFLSLVPSNEAFASATQGFLWSLTDTTTKLDLHG